MAEGLSRAETVEAVKRAAGRPRTAGPKGRGVRTRKVTHRVIRTMAGIRITLECRKGLHGSSIEAALEQALATIQAETKDGRAAA